MEKLPPERSGNGEGDVITDLNLSPHKEGAFEQFRQLAKRLLAVKREEMIPDKSKGEEHID